MQSRQSQQSRKPKCPACSKDGNIETKEQRLRGVMQHTFGFFCKYCGYQVQNKLSEDELLESIHDDRNKIHNLSKKPKND